MKKQRATTLPLREFEARRLHNLLLAYEHAVTMRDRLRAGDAVAVAARAYLAWFHGLRGRN